MRAPLPEVYWPGQMILGVDRLALADFPEPAVFGQENQSAELDWEQVHRVIQQSFRRMAICIRQRRPDISSEAGRTGIRPLSLFSYRTFEVPADQAIAPIVVGIDFDPAKEGNDLTVRGDISAEETGAVFYKTKRLSIPMTQEGILAAALQLARELTLQREIVFTQLVQPCFSQQR